MKKTSFALNLVMTIICVLVLILLQCPLFADGNAILTGVDMLLQGFKNSQLSFVFIAWGQVAVVVSECLLIAILIVCILQDAAIISYKYNKLLYILKNFLVVLQVAGVALVTAGALVVVDDSSLFGLICPAYFVQVIFSVLLLFLACFNVPYKTKKERKNRKSNW